MFIQKVQGNVLIFALVLSLLSSSVACTLLGQIIIHRRIVHNFCKSLGGMNNHKGLSYIYRRVDEHHVQKKES